MTHPPQRPGPARLRALGLCLLAAAALAALAAGANPARRDFIRSFFTDGRPGPAPALPQPPAGTPGLAPVERLRVILIDGLGADASTRLPNLNALCKEGLDLGVDVGFPTVSLPVQCALWSGLTQQQSGIQYQTMTLRETPAGALPRQVAGSHAVAESHPEIVGSFGFSRAEPPLRASYRDLPAGWREAGFLAAARAAVAGDERLVFVHVLRVDETGHRKGGASAEYRQAAREADEILGTLLADERAAHPGGTRWVALSDHGHRPAGGHAGAEPGVRLVRACIAGGPLPAPAELAGRWIHLVDLSRALFDSLGVAPPDGARGRPIPFAVAHPAIGATLPRPGLGRWVVAALVAAAALLCTWRAARPRPGEPRWALLGCLPLWWPVAYLAIVLGQGAATLSNPMIYPPQGRAMLVGGWPGLVVLAAAGAVGLWRAGAARMLVGQLAVPIAACLGPLILCGGATRLLGIGDQPPLAPIWTAHASLGLSLLVTGSAAAALLALAAAARAWFGRAAG